MSIPVRLLRDENSRIERELAIAAAERDALDARIAKLWKMSEGLRWIIRADAPPGVTATGGAADPGGNTPNSAGEREP